MDNTAVCVGSASSRADSGDGTNETDQRQHLEGLNNSYDLRFRRA